MKKLLSKGKVIVSFVSVVAILAVSVLSMFAGSTVLVAADDSTESTFGSRTYSIGVNPYTYASASSPDTILLKLGQK